ncbi:MAG TPA: replicative DNA helicase, partial [candidate division WOR-3 bacterium]|nr:replicative DNA helicase [candidate division WOR-3 bacterium]
MDEIAGRRPPQSLEAEAAVLGAMLLRGDAVARVLEVLGHDPAHFYLEAHRKVYAATLACFDAGRPADVVTVAAELKHRRELDGIGGLPFLSGLLESVLTTAHCTEHARLVLEKSVQRQLIGTATEIVQKSYDDTRPVDELLDDAEQRIFDIRQAGTRQGFQVVKDLLMPEMERIERAAQEKRLITGVETGFPDLDEKTSGFQKGDLIIIAGRPSMGKTALALNIAVNASLRSKTREPVAIFSLEMSTEALVQRLICAEADVSMKNLRRGMLSRADRARLSNALGPLKETQIYIDDSPALNALDIRARARRLKAEVPLGLIIIDYLQLMEAHHTGRRERNRQQEISDTTRALKAMAKELDTPVAVLSQLSRAAEARPDKRPQLADLRESGAIEQDADLVLLLYRAKFYKPAAPDVTNLADVIIAKQRNGPLGLIQLTFLDECMRFENPYLASAGAPAEDARPAP